MNISIFWNIAPCSSYVNRRFGGVYHIHFQGRKSAEHVTHWFLTLLICDREAEDHCSLPKRRFTYE
jgi:hypothetical protein